MKKCYVFNIVEKTGRSTEKKVFSDTEKEARVLLWDTLCSAHKDKVESIDLAEVIS